MEENRVVLLKNEGDLLPLDYRRPKFLGITGPYADCRWNSDVTFRKALKRYLRDSFIQLEYHPIEEGADALRHCDVLLAVLGPETGDASPQEQLQILKQLPVLKKPVFALVLGEAWNLEGDFEEACAVLWCPRPGSGWVHALAEALFVLPE